jgi:hypothetical protein
MDVSYYITLPCVKDSDSDKLEDYNTNLGKNFNLDGEWEAGLAEISFPKTWYTLPSDQHFEFLFFHPDKLDFMEVLTSKQCVIKKGDYSIEEIVYQFEELKHPMWDHDWNLKGLKNKRFASQPELKKEPNDKYVWMRKGILYSNELVYVRFSKELGNILGFTYEDQTKQAIETFKKYKEYRERKIQFPGISRNDEQAYNGPSRHFDLKYYSKKLLVKTDLIKDSLYGSKNTNLLRIVEIPKDTCFGDQITQTFDTPIYFPLQTKIFNSIKIDVFNSIKEERAQFQAGFIYVTIHLRRVVNSFLYEVPVVKGTVGIPSVQENVQNIDENNKENSNSESKDPIPPPQIGYDYTYDRRSTKPVT